MRNQNNSNEHLVDEVAALRSQIAALRSTDLEQRQLITSLQNSVARPVGSQAVVQDEKEKEAEYQLKLLQFSIDRAGHSTFFIGPDARFIYVNDAACDSLGYTREELLKLTLHDIDPSFTVEMYDKAKAEKQLGRSITFESSHLHKSGRVIPVEVTTSHLEFGDQSYACAFTRDITQRKLTEEQQRLTQFLIEQAGDGIFWLSPDLKFVYANKAACLMTGYSKEELLGMHLNEINESFSTEAWPEIWETMKGGETLTIGAHHRTKQGGLIPVEVTANYLLFDGREISCAFVRDIRVRLSAEEALRSSEERYRTLVTQSSEGIWRLEFEEPLSCKRPGR